MNYWNPSCNFMQKQSVTLTMAAKVAQVWHNAAAALRSCNPVPDKGTKILKAYYTMHSL